jgi:hypothetical protein
MRIGVDVYIVRVTRRKMNYLEHLGRMQPVVAHT